MVRVVEDGKLLGDVQEISFDSTGEGAQAGSRAVGGQAEVHASRPRLSGGGTTTQTVARYHYHSWLTMLTTCRTAPQ